jgi:gamma-glutamylcyclotransferase
VSEGAGRVKYFAYGANIHPGWLGRRVPEAELLGTARLPGYRLTFRKRGRDGAARSDACPDDTPGACLHGALYALPAGALQRLGAAGAGYREERVRIETAWGTVEARTWRAAPEDVAEGLRPWDWYLALIRAGAELLGLPDEYRRWLDGVAVTEDPDSDRARAAREVIAAAADRPRGGPEWVC